MSNLLQKIGFLGKSGGPQSNGDELPDIFPMPITFADFVAADMEMIFSKILTDVIERTNGIPEEIEAVLWDSCVMSNASDGLVTLLADAMVRRAELYLVLDAGVIREATNEEKTKIRSDYEKEAESSTGVYISFKNYRRSEMLEIYSGLEYCNIGSLHKSMNLSMAIQIKTSDLRASVSLADSGIASAQAVLLAKSLKEGRAVNIDAKDIIETAKPDIAATNASTTFVQSKRAFILGLPASYLSGDQTAGMGSSGDADTRAIERGLKPYFATIIKPVILGFFPDTDLVYKTQDTRQIGQGLEAMKTFDVTSNDLVTHDEKRLVLASLFDLETADDKNTK